MSKTRVAIIGCGPSGMACLAAFNQAEMKGDIIPEIVCYEKQDKIGGLWNYTWRTGTDEYGEPCHNGMYRYLFTNGPKECFEMGDYPYEEHFGRSIPSFAPRPVLLDYLMGKAKKNNIQRFVQLNTVIRNVEERDDQFLVSTFNQKSKKGRQEIFDYVIVATGHFSFPSVPNIEGVENFNGRIMHSHDFRDACAFKGQKLLLIGNSFSAEDIALQCYKYSTKNSIISYQSKPTGFKWPEGIIEIPQLMKYEDGKFHFADGSAHEADVLIYCTGYLHYFPFMTEKLRLQCPANTLYPDHLYKGIVFQKNRNVFYMGMQNQYYTFSMFDAQAWFARDFILGKIQKKSSSEMKEDIKHWRERLSTVTSESDVDFQKDYVRDLLSYTDFPEHGSDERAMLWKQLKVHRKEDIVTYRDHAFVSVMSGKMTPNPKLPWIENWDDSLAAYTDYPQD